MKNGGIPTTVELEMANFETFPFKGKVETIEADFNQETGNIAFRATFDNPDKILRHGETGNILVRKDFKDALIIPQISTFEVLEKRFVYKVENGVLKAVPVKIKAELPHIFIVESGLTAKDTILLEGLNRVHNEETIIPVFKKPQSVYNHLDLYAE
jgi:membrane fusion protein (multidrug efflux system)